jgi:hypothetical protein
VVLGKAGDLRVANVFNRIGAASVLGKGCIVIVNFPGLGIKDDVLQD